MARRAMLYIRAPPAACTPRTCRAHGARVRSALRSADSGAPRQTTNTYMCLCYTLCSRLGLPMPCTLPLMLHEYSPWPHAVLLLLMMTMLLML